MGQAGSTGGARTAGPDAEVPSPHDRQALVPLLQLVDAAQHRQRLQDGETQGD